MNRGGNKMLPRNLPNLENAEIIKKFVLTAIEDKTEIDIDELSNLKYKLFQLMYKSCQINGKKKMPNINQLGEIEITIGRGILSVHIDYGQVRFFEAEKNVQYELNNCSIAINKLKDELSKRIEETIKNPKEIDKISSLPFNFQFNELEGVIDKGSSNLKEIKAKDGSVWITTDN